MANNAGRHTRQIVANIESVVAIELLMAAQALELRMRLPATAGAKPGVASLAALAYLRSTASADGRAIDHLTEDVVLYPRLRKAGELVHDGSVVAAVNAAIGGGSRDAAADR
jgi:histidine ammonia-lyase